MGRRLLYIILLLMAWAYSLEAQEVPVTALDGPVLKADTLENRPKAVPLRPGFLRSYRSPSFRAPSSLSPSLLPPGQMEFETKEQFAARINARTYAAVMSSVDSDLYWHRMPKYSRPVKVAMSIAGLFLSNPFGFREGYVPLMNHSFPFIFAATPGWAPYEYPYSTEAFPQSIGAEFDLATGTYKQKVLDWSEVQKNMTRSFGGSFKYEPVPYVPVTPVERAMQQH